MILYFTEVMRGLLPARKPVNAHSSLHMCIGTDNCGFRIFCVADLVLRERQREVRLTSEHVNKTIRHMLHKKLATILLATTDRALAQHGANGSRATVSPSAGL